MHLTGLVGTLVVFSKKTRRLRFMQPNRNCPQATTTGTICIVQGIDGSTSFARGVGTMRSLCLHLPYSPSPRTPGANSVSTWYSFRIPAGRYEAFWANSQACKPCKSMPNCRSRVAQLSAKVIVLVSCGKTLFHASISNPVYACLKQQ